MAHGCGCPGLKQHSRALHVVVWLMAAALILAAPVFAPGQGFVFSTSTLALGGTNSNPIGIQVTDFNGDGVPDIASLNAGSGTVSLFLGQGGGTFAAPMTIAVGSGPSAMVVADFNRDGKPDIAVSFTSATAFKVLLGKGDGTFGTTLSIGTGGSSIYSMSVTDFNGDGIPDIVATDFNHNLLLVYPGKGDGTFLLNILTTGLDPSSVAFADINQDGRKDIIVTNQFDGTATAYLGNATGFSMLTGFTGSFSVPNVTSVVSGDFNNDGLDDLAFVSSAGAAGGVTEPLPRATSGGSITVIVNRASRPGLFNAPVTIPIPGTGLSNLAAADFNGDGVTDLVAPSGSTNSLQIFDGITLALAGTLFANEVRPFAASPAASVGTGPGPTGVVVADLNGDGKPDMLAPNSGGSSIGVYLNGSQTRIIPQTGWWWDPTLNGIGFFIETGGASGNGLFAGGFLYDASGNSTWLVSTGQMNAVLSYSNSWLKVTGGQTLTGVYQPPSGNTNAGAIQLTFLDASHATMVRPNGTTVNLHRFSFTSTPIPAPVAGAPQNGWWWAGSASSGTGYGIEIQGSSVFIVAYVYDGAGNPVWYLATGSLTTATSYIGSWYQYKSGPQLTSPEGKYGASQIASSAVAMTLTFSDATHGTLTMGNVVIPIVRFQQF
jgi:hypothetical protein